MDIELTCALSGQKLNTWQNFLAESGLEADRAVEQTVLVWEDDQLIATGSRQGNLLKCLAVDPAHQGEGLLAKFMGKKKIIAETGAGQHGVAIATAAAYFGMECDVYMGKGNKMSGCC